MLGGGEGGGPEEVGDRGDRDVGVPDLAVAGALAEGYEASFIVDAVGDNYKEQHDTAVLRLAHAGGVPNTTVGMTCEWFRDWKSPLAGLYLKTIVPYYDELAALKRAPVQRAGRPDTTERSRPEGLTPYIGARSLQAPAR